MKKRNMVLIGFVGLSITALGVYAQSITATPPGECTEHQRHGHMMGGGPGRLIHVLMRSTDMTQDQQTQAHSILDANRSAMQGIFPQLRQANTDLANLLLGPQDVPADALANQLAKINLLQLQLEQQSANTVLAIRAQLRPEQVAKAAAAETQIEADKAAHHHFMMGD